MLNLTSGRASTSSDLLVTEVLFSVLLAVTVLTIVPLPIILTTKYKVLDSPIGRESILQPLATTVL